MPRTTRRPVRVPAAPVVPDTEAELPPEGAHTVPAIVVLPLRLFLGLTFVYAAIQKLTDPGFLHPGSTTYIGAQLLGFSRGSPIRFFLLQAADHAIAVGLLTILTEFAIGLCVLLGIATRPAALVGAALNLIFFLSASWHTYPYFMGSDIVFVIAWVTLALSGPGPFSLGRLVESRMLPELRPDVRRLALGPETATLAGQSLITRGEAIVGLAVTAVLVFLGIADHAGSVGVPSAAGGSLGGKSSNGTPASGQGTASRGTGNSAAPAGMKKIGNMSQLPPNSAGMVQDPASGDPVIIVRTDQAHIYAYDAVCTHAGCTVQYDPSQKLIVCPCHGGEFDPSHGAQVVAGPPPTPLGKIGFKVDNRGNIYIA